MRKQLAYLSMSTSGANELEALALSKEISEAEQDY
jgi:hypothetical protein